MKIERPPFFAAPILVIDLEVTCEDGDVQPASEMETIEIGAVWATAEAEANYYRQLASQNTEVMV